MSNCIGIDVGKQELVVFDGRGHEVFANGEDLSVLEEYLHSRGSGLKVIFEPTSTYSRQLEDLCTRNRIAFRLVNPTIVPHLRCVERVRSKTDRSDAQLLHQYGNREDIVEDPPRDRCAREIASILSIYRLLQRNRIALQGGLDAYRREPLLPKALCTLLEEEIQRYKVFEKDIVKLAEKTAAEGGRKEKLEILKSIPGVGPVVALHLLVFFSTFQDADRKQITALAGLDPVRRESGISVHVKPRISKQGNAQFRKMTLDV